MRRRSTVWKGRDDGRRPLKGLVISVLPIRPGSVRFIFDDVDRVARRPTTWRHNTFVTFADVPASVLRRASQKKLAGLGLTVLGILNTPYERVRNARPKSQT